MDAQMILKQFVKSYYMRTWQISNYIYKTIAEKCKSDVRAVKKFKLRVSFKL